MKKMNPVIQAVRGYMSYGGDSVGHARGVLRALEIGALDFGASPAEIASARNILTRLVAVYG